MSDASPSVITPASTAVPPAQLVCAPTVREWPGLSIPELAAGPRSRHQLFQHANLLYDALLTARGPATAWRSVATYQPLPTPASTFRAPAPAYAPARPNTSATSSTELLPAFVAPPCLHRGLAVAQSGIQCVTETITKQIDG